jgi:transcriptional regulator with XRE-family HTH domain
MALGDRLKELREFRGWNQKEAAEKLGLELSKYNKWENGKNAPAYDEVIRLADFYDVTCDSLLGRVSGTAKLSKLTYEVIAGFSALEDDKRIMITNAIKDVFPDDALVWYSIVLRRVDNPLFLFCSVQ